MQDRAIARQDMQDKIRDLSTKIEFQELGKAIKIYPAYPAGVRFGADLAYPVFSLKLSFGECFFSGSGFQVRFPILDVFEQFLFGRMFLHKGKIFRFAAQMGKFGQKMKMAFVIAGK